MSTQICWPAFVLICDNASPKTLLQLACLSKKHNKYLKSREDYTLSVKATIMPNKLLLVSARYNLLWLTEWSIAQGGKNYGQSLCEACLRGHIRIADRLISNDPIYNTALRHACEGGHSAMIEWCVTHGANSMNIALMGACAGGHLDRAEWAVSQGGRNFNTGLYYACWRNHMIMAEWCVGQGARDFNQAFKGACRGGHTNMIEWCLDMGANNYNDGLEGACCGGHVEVAEACRKRGANNIDRGFQMACTYGMLHTAVWCYNQGVKIPERGLYSACRHGHLHMVQWCLEKFGTYSTARKVAFDNNQTDVVRWLDSQRSGCVVC